MSRNLFTNLLKKAFTEILQEMETNKRYQPQDRRKFIHDTSYAAGGLALIPSFLRGDDAQALFSKSKKVAIVGAGIAGLNACYQLKKHGIHATLYESSVRAGGRMFTLKDSFDKGVTTDIGGEFVDITHTEIIRLMKELDLPFYDLRKDPLEAKELFFGGKHISNQELKNAIRPFVPALLKDVRSLPQKIDYHSADRFRHLDNQSITGYISGIGIKGWLHDFIQVVLTREYGMEASEQSAINFLIMFQSPDQTSPYYELFGDGHEIMKIKGGSQQLTDALYEKVKSQVQFNYQLTSVQPGKQNNGYSLSFQVDNKTSRVEADYVLLAIPFSILRHIPFQVEMPEGKRKCIQEMGYGNSCKFILGMNTRPWRSHGKQGYLFADLAPGCGWDSSQSQSSQKGSFTVFGGGHLGDDIYNRKSEDLAGEYLSGLEKIYPGSAAAYNKTNIKYCWASNPYVKGGYSSFKKGQWSTLAGWEAVPVGNIYFAGEHVSREFQGYMNGGAMTGKAAAMAMIEKMSVKA